MTGTNHGMTGAAIALLIKEPALAVPLSFASHFACDAIPHYGLAPGAKLFDSSFNKSLIGDFLLAAGLMAILGMIFPAEKWLIWACMVAAASPDLMWAYYELYLKKIKGRKFKLDPLAKFHSWIQWSQTPKGFYLEIAWFLLMGYLVLA